MAFDRTKMKTQDTDRKFDDWTVTRHGQSYIVEIRYLAPRVLSIDDEIKTPRFVARSVEPPINVASSSLLELRKAIEEKLDAWINAHYSHVLVIRTASLVEPSDHRHADRTILQFEYIPYTVAVLGDGSKIFRRDQTNMWSYGELLDPRNLLRGEDRNTQFSIVPDTPENRQRLDAAAAKIKAMADMVKNLFRSEQVNISLAAMNIPSTLALPAPADTKEITDELHV